MTQYRPRYTSMKCLAENDEEWYTPWQHDEPYAIFLGINWWRKSADVPTVWPRWFVKRTNVYSKVDAGESRGAHNKRDDKNLTSCNGFETSTQATHMILVQAMEHDYGSANTIVATLQRLMGGMATKLIVTAGGNRDVVIAVTQPLMTVAIDVARYVRGSKQAAAFLKGMDKWSRSLAWDPATWLPGLRTFQAGWDGILGLANPDDRIGAPKVLNLSPRRQERTFGKSPNGRYAYRFSIDTR